MLSYSSALGQWFENPIARFSGFGGVCSHTSSSSHVRHWVTGWHRMFKTAAEIGGMCDVFCGRAVPNERYSLAQSRSEDSAPAHCLQTSNRPPFALKVRLRATAQTIKVSGSLVHLVSLGWPILLLRRVQVDKP